MNTAVFERYGDEYFNQIKRLEMAITFDPRNITSSNMEEAEFTAFGLEAGLGKSIETDRIIGEYLSGLGKSSFLLVKKFKDDVHESVKRIRKYYDSDSVIGITKDNWSQFRNKLADLSQYQVLVITHQRYLQLCVDSNLRKYFQANRHTLIIDEQIDLPIKSFNEDFYRKLREKLPVNFDLYKVCEGLFNEITLQSNKARNNTIYACKPTVDGQLVADFESSILANKGNIQNYNKVQEAVETIKIMYTNRGSISTYDGRLVLWGLQNNIILDANAKLDKRYRANLKVIPFPKIIDHYGSTIHWVKYNSSRSNIRKSENYYEEVCKAVSERRGNQHKTLIVCHKGDQPTLVSNLKVNNIYSIGEDDNYNGEEVAVAHFGAIIGKNYWREFNQVWVVANPLIRMEVYPLYYKFFSQLPGMSKEVEMVAKKGSYQFKHEGYEEIRFGCVVSEIYQAIKRVDREGVNGADYFIVHGDEKVFQKVKSQLKNVKQGNTIELDIIKQEKIEGELQAKPSKADEFSNLLKTLKPKKYPKAEIIKMLGWEDGSNLSKCYKHKDVEAMKQAGILVISHQTIEILEISLRR